LWGAFFRNALKLEVAALAEAKNKLGQALAL